MKSQTKKIKWLQSFQLQWEDENSTFPWFQHSLYLIQENTFGRSEYWNRIIITFAWVLSTCRHKSRLEKFLKIVTLCMSLTEVYMINRVETTSKMDGGPRKVNQWMYFKWSFGSKRDKCMWLWLLIWIEKRWCFTTTTSSLAKQDFQHCAGRIRRDFTHIWPWKLRRIALKWFDFFLCFLIFNFLYFGFHEIE